MNEIIAGYELLETIHEAPSGTSVFRAVRTSDGKKVIVKTLSTTKPRAEDIARLEHEFALGQKLRDSGIVAHYELLRYESTAALVLEDFGATSLSLHMAQKGATALDTGRFLHLARAITEGLVELHEAGVIHNDICPANLLVTPNEETVKIADLGMATRLLRTEQHAYHPKELEGTLAYMSPERTGRMNRAVDHRADLYSLGATFYAMLTGEPPFAATDPMGMIHAHIARPPTPLTTVRPDLPEVISHIVLTLLAKTPEERYQSATGILSDLDIAQESFAKTGNVPTFDLRKNDRQLHFSVSEKLYGRNDHVRKLLDAFERASTGGLEVVLLRGLPGIGKSVLVHEVHKPIVARRGTFASGKFDQLAQATPLAGVTQALRQLLRQLLTESPERLRSWREKLLAIAGDDGAAMFDVLPEAVHLLGEQPPAVDLGPRQNRERFDRVLRALVNTFASAEHPLVLFFDDLQWVDAASLRFLTGLASNAGSKHILLIGAVRSNEVDQNHPLSLALEKVALAGTPVLSVTLESLGPDELSQMASDSLARTQEDVVDLAALLHQKTGGNPFFVTQFLRGLVDDKLLRFDRENRQWTWDMAAIARLSVVGDVGPFMSSKIARYNAETREVLALASCLGTSFELDTLAIISGREPRETAKALWQPMEDGLLLPLDAGFHYAHLLEGTEPTSLTTLGAADPLQGTKPQTPSWIGSIRYRFAHDRIQEASHAQIPEGRVKETSLGIARLLLKRLSPEQKAERLFDIASHFRVAHSLVTDPIEKREVAKLHLETAQRAKAATAYATALAHADAGILLFDENAWETDYRLFFQLHRERIDCEFLNGNMDRAQAAYDHAAKRVKGNVDTADIAQLFIRILLTADRPADGLDVGRRSLKEMGVVLPAETADAGAAMAEEQTRIDALLGDDKVRDLIDHRVMNDFPMEMCLGLLHETWTCAVMTGNFQEVAHTALKIVRLSIENGNCKFSACGYVAHAAVLSANGKYELAREYGELSMTLSHKFADVFIIPKVHNTFANFTNHWVHHLRTNIKVYEESYAACRQSGDRWWGAWAVGWIRTAQLISGVRIDEVLATADKYHPYIEASGYTPLVHMSTLDRQILLCLLGRTEGPSSLTGLGVTDESIEKVFTDMGFGFGQHLYYNYKSLLAWLVGEYEAAATFSRKADVVKDHIPGLMPYPDFFLYNTLALASRGTAIGEKEKAENRAAIDRNIERMKVWAHVCPENFEHRLLLMEAERARLDDNDAEASSLYERAINAASAHGYIQNAAIASECAANHQLNEGRERAARGYLADAAYLYERWGAIAKAASLRANAMGRASGPPSISGAKLPAPVNMDIALYSTGRIGHGDLDLATVMEAAGAISSELKQERLLERLLTLSMRHAGAQRAFFLMDESGRTRVISKLTMLESGEIGVIADDAKTFALPIEERNDIALSVVRYVERTGETLAIDNASEDSRFARDAYVSRVSAKSILCLPVKQKGAQVGLLYLDNDLTVSAFNSGHVRLLQLLAAQAAISIENAALYDTLEQKVHLRTRELADTNMELVKKNEEILRAQAQLVQSEKMASLGQLVAGVAHEINNPINFIASGLPSLRRDMDKIAEMVPAASRDGTFDKVRIRLAKLMTAIQDGTQRTGDIVKNLRSFSRLDEAAHKSVDLHEALDSTLALLASKLNEGIKVEKRYGELPLVECYASQLNQVWMNLLANAVYAMGEKGVLTLSTRRIDQRSVEISIGDTGKGIPDDIKAKIFDPFFTTKPVGEGTGLGLSISHEIIAKHKGRIIVESAPNVGTTFRITLPLDGATLQE